MSLLEQAWTTRDLEVATRDATCACHMWLVSATIPFSRAPTSRSIPTPLRLHNVADGDVYHTNNYMYSIADSPLYFVCMHPPLTSPAKISAENLSASAPTTHDTELLVVARVVRASYMGCAPRDTEFLGCPYHIPAISVYPFNQDFIR